MALSNMMNGMGGIGQQAADLRASNTPQQLQQGYEKSVKDGTPSLSYLMAISSLAEEVERRKRDIDAKMEEKPGTILEQRAKKLKNLTVGQNTSEKAEQVGGIAQLQQRMAQGAQGAPQGTQGPPQGPQMAPQGPPQGATQMAASGGIIMQGAPNMQRMAGGGIIGFASRGEVKARTRAQLLEEVGVTEAEYARYTEEEKAELLKTINRNRMLAREVGTGISPNTTLAGLYDAASMPITAAGKAIGTVGKAVGLMDPQSSDPLQRYNPDGEQTWTPALDAINRQATRNQPITRQQLMGASTPQVGPFEGPEGDLTGINAVLGARARQQPSTNVRTPPIERPIAQGPGPARIARKEVPPFRLPPTVIGANTAKYSDRQGKLDERQAALDKALLAEKAGRVGGATRARDDAADFSNRGGVQGQYAAMLAQRQALAKEQAAGRADSSFLRTTSGMVPMGNPGQSYAKSKVRDMDETDRLARNALTRQEAIQIGGIETDKGIAGKALDVQRTTTASNAQLDAQVMKAMQQSITDQGRNLNAAEQRALAARVANMTAAEKRIEIESRERVSRLDIASRESIAAARTKQEARANDLREIADNAKTRSEKDKVKARIAIAIADVKKQANLLIAERIKADVSILKMGPEQQKAAKLKITQAVRTSLNMAVTLLEKQLKKLNTGVTPKDKR